jgi:hypothetical protein
VNRKVSITIALFVLGAVHGTSSLGHAQNAPAPTTNAPYPAMAPLDQYLMADRDAEIRLARSAAPPAISDHAQVLVLGRHGYETAVQGSNGFTCVVERSWMSSLDSPEFWNPKLRGPLCFNPAAARSVLPLTYKRTELILATPSIDQMIAGLKLALDKDELPLPELGAMSYMLSNQSYLGDKVGHAVPHLMFYAYKSSDWGQDLPNSPVILSHQFEGTPEPLRCYIIPVFNWSDGTPSPMGEHSH